MIRPTTSSKLALMAAVFVLLTACGGGGGDSGSAAPPAVPDPPNPGTPDPVFGLDTRAANTSCVAPARPIVSSISTPRAFPSISFHLPVLMLQAPQDSTRWYVVQQGGQVKLFTNSSTAATSSTVIDISARVASPDSGANGELGLLGMAFHPNFSTNHFVYLFYSHVGHPVVSYLSRFSSLDNGLTWDPASEQVLLTVTKPYNNHNGGNLAFGADGYLYVGYGDGGSGDDPQNLAQNPQRLLGKMIRIDVDGGSPYGIPADNPYRGNALCNTGTGSANCPEIYATGLRNPWRWSFDSATNILWAGDVGQNTYEEVDQISRGGNYGWRCREGMHVNPDAGVDLSACPVSGLIDPVAEYDHTLGQSITGGYVYRGSAIAGLVGSYLFADYVSGRIWALRQSVTSAFERIELADTPYLISSFAQGNDNELYFLSYSDGQIHALQAGGGASAGGVPTLLSQTGCVSANDARQPASGLIPYAPNASFWSDGAAKSRWLAVPDGQTIGVASDGDFAFPNGSVLVKNFNLNGQLVETRLFMRHPDGVWAGYSYEWNSAQTDATLVPSVGKTKAVGTQTWIYPSQAQCLQCHTAGAGYTLGLEVSQLDGDLPYPLTGRTANQMSTLTHIGMFSSTPASVAALPDPFGSAPLASRARAYLHSNCSGCHRPNGGTPSNLDLRYTTTLAQTNACGAAPQAGTLGVANAKIIAPGDAGSSVLVSRMNRRPPDTNGMPPVASSLPDSDGVNLITAWIDSLQSCN